MRLLIFDPEMTKEVYSGRKTMARIAMDDQPTFTSNYAYCECEEDGSFRDGRGKLFTFPYKRVFPLREWWRETDGLFQYRTDSPDDAGKWRNPNNMLLKHTRVWIEITVIYLERFSEISGHEFDAEGIKPAKNIGIPSYWNYSMHNYSCKTKQDSIISYYAKKNKHMDMTNWAWVIHFQHLTAI